MGRKYRDRNGFLHLEGTPISRVQVAPYYGKNIDPKNELKLDPPLKKDGIYFAYRSPEALFDENTMASLEGLPFRVGHQMLGKGEKKVDDAPVDGSISNIRKDESRPDYLLADIVVYTDKAINAIARGVKELSLGYRCSYLPVDTYPEPEYQDGQPFHFYQVNIVANHLALVPRGRAGSTVSVQDEALVTEDGLVITCDSLPEEIQIMEENEKKAKDKLKELLQSSEEVVQDCLDYCDLTKEQKDAIKGMKAGKEKVAQDSACPNCGCKDKKVEDACPKCGYKEKKVKDEKPAPTPPEPVKTEEETGKEDKTPAPATEGAPSSEPAPAPATGEPAPATEPAAAASEPAPAPAKTEENAAPTEEQPTEDGGTKKGGKCKGRNCTITQDEFDIAVNKARNEGEEAGRAAAKAEAEEAAKKIGKTYTQDEMDDAVAKAEKKGRADGYRANELAVVLGEDADIEKSEADVARAACKKIKGLESYAQDSVPDGEVLAAIRGHLSNKKAEKSDDKPAKKTLVTVAQDEAIAKTPASFNPGRFAAFLAK